MKDLIARRLIFSVFMTLMLAFSIQSITEAQVPEIIVPQKIEPQTSESSHEDDTVSIATRFDIAISEIMYATNPDKLPQWIELHTRSERKISLEGWEVTIKNHPEDKSVLATTVTFTLGAKVLDRNQVLLLVTEQGPNSGVGTAKGDIPADHAIILKDLIGGTPGYRLLSQTAFKITLKAPVGKKTSRKVVSDTAGNLEAVPEWKLPLIEGNQRSSITRAYEGINATGEPYDGDGTAADGWELTGKKGTQYITRHTTYYGHSSDHGTPGYRTREPLLVGPSHLLVKLSKFRPERKKSTGEVVIKWITEAEMNNAGFHIKRSSTRDGEFKIIAMIPGAGTTDKRQIYTYTDKTAKPNVVYYYQIECVSIDGTRQILRRTHLRGSIVPKSRGGPLIL